MEDKDGTRTVYARNWKKEFKLKKCKKCGNYWAPEAQLEYIQKKANLPSGFFDVCPNCRESVP
jgi:membrane protease subunit (stomatin/prohibitin family)